MLYYRKWSLQSWQQKNVTLPQPCILYQSTGDFHNISKVYLIIENSVYCQLPADEAPVALVSAFYVYSMEYTAGCSNLHNLLECLSMGKKIAARKKFQLSWMNYFLKKKSRTVTILTLLL